MIAVFLIWPYSLVISRQSPAAKVRLVVKPTIIASLSACKNVAQSINSFLKCSIKILPIFDHAHPKQLEVIFTCPEFVLTFEKSVYSVYLFFRYSQCWSPVSRVLKPTWLYPHKSFLINFDFHKFNFFFFFWNMLKIRLFHHFVVEILYYNILSSLRNQIFYKHGICAR